jgi:hypothetical protein
MNNLFLKIKFFIKKYPIIVIAGSGVNEIISQVLEKKYKLKKNIFIFETEKENKKIEDFSFFFKNSEKPVLLLSGEKTISPRNFPRRDICLIFNNDDQKAKEAGDWSTGRKISFGFNQKADVFVSDIIVDSEEVNFKINYKGSSVPFWIKKPIQENKSNQWIYSILSAVCAGLIFDLNLVEISEALNVDFSRK